MPATVKTTRFLNGEHVTVTHPTANNVDVKDGHLLARRWNGVGYDNVAVYAPGQWVDATTEQPEAK